MLSVMVLTAEGRRRGREISQTSKQDDKGSWDHRDSQGPLPWDHFLGAANVNVSESVLCLCTRTVMLRLGDLCLTRQDRYTQTLAFPRSITVYRERNNTKDAMYSTGKPRKTTQTAPPCCPRPCSCSPSFRSGCGRERHRRSWRRSTSGASARRRQAPSPASAPARRRRPYPHP